MTPLFILGAGGQAKDTYCLLRDIQEANGLKSSPSYRFGGFVDLNSGQLKVGKEKFRVFSEEEFFKHVETFSSMALVLGVGTPSVNAKIIQKWLAHPFVRNQKIYFPNLVHPSAVGRFDEVSMGMGNVVTARCVFSTDIKLGSFNIFNISTTIGHDSIIGSYNVFNPGSIVSGGVQIGDQCLLGSNCTILQYLKLGNHTIVGAGAVVTKDVAGSATLVGVPAREMKKPARN